MSELQKNLARIQKELKAPKNQRNNFGKYNYRSCEDILEALKPLLSPCVLTINDEIIAVGERIYVKAIATLHLNAETISTSAFAREEENKKGMDSSQLTGSTSSYARKYALNGLFAIDDNKCSDATNKHGADKPLNAPESASSGKIEDYIIPMGKMKGKKFKEVDRLDLVDYCKWLSTQEDLNDRATHFINNARHFLRNQN